MIETKDATLTKTQKNRILEFVVKYGPPPSDFQWTEKEQEESLSYSTSKRPYRVSILTHRPTNYYCIFGAHSIKISPGHSAKVESFSHEDRWEKKESTCGKWLIVVKKEVEAPDLWAAIAQERILPTAASAAVDNRHFTPEERSLIHAKLDGIKAYLLDGQDFTTEQAETVEREFAYLRESSKRLGRKDWLNNLLGGVVGLAIALALDPQKAKGLLGLAGSAFQSLWDVAQSLLQ
jgi:hypothetical protein